jgi:hypothetical protein
MDCGRSKAVVIRAVGDGFRLLSHSSSEAYVSLTDADELEQDDHELDFLNRCSEQYSNQEATYYSLDDTHNMLSTVFIQNDLSSESVRFCASYLFRADIQKR